MLVSGSVSSLMVSCMLSQHSIPVQEDPDLLGDLS